MKFLHYALLVCGASAMKLKQMNLMSLDKKVDEVTEAEWEELGEALYSYTADGESLSFPEMKKEVVDWAKENDVEPFKGWQKALKHIFKMIDTNGDKEISRAEADAAIKEHEDIQLGSMSQLMAEGPMEDIEAGVKAELKKDGGVTLDELYAIIEGVAAKYDFDINGKCPGWKKHVKKMFDWVDANGDGTVTGPEIEAAMKKAGGKKEDDLVQLTAHLTSGIHEQLRAEGPMEDIEAGVKAELKKDGGVSLDELYAIIEGVAKKYKFDIDNKAPGWKKHVKKMFDWVDANGDGVVTGPEIEAAMKKAGGKKEDDLVQLKSQLKSALGDEPTEEQWNELGKAIWDETEGDETLELKELYGLIMKWAKKHDLKPPKGWKKDVKEIFDYVDANSDGHVTRDELKSAFEKEEEGEDEEEVQLSKKKGKKGKKDKEEVQLSKKGKKGKKAKDTKDLQLKLKSALQLGEGPSQEQWEELGKAIWDATEGDESLQLDELIDLIEAWATKHGFADKLPKGWKKYVKQMFDYVDKNGDGDVTRDELEACMKGEEEKEDIQLSKKGKKGKKDIELSKKGKKGKKEDK